MPTPHWLTNVFRPRRARKVDMAPLRYKPNEVQTAAGLKHLADLVVGDVLKSLDPSSGKEIENKITDIEHLKGEKFYLVVNGNLPMHKNQSVMQPDGNVTHAFRLKVGDNLVGADGELVPIVSINRVHSPYPFVKLAVDGDHTYVLNGILVHNASRYWVGGTAAWDGTAGTKWATTSGGGGGSAIPSTSDDVFLDAASGAVTVTVSTGNTGCLSLNCTGFTGTLAGSGALTIAGSLTLATGMTRTYTGTLTFSSTSTGRTITLNGKTTASTVNFTGVGGGWTVQDNWNNGASAFVHTSGTLDTNGKTITASFFTSSGILTRTLTLGASTFTLSVGWTLSGNSLTFNANTSSINLSSNNVTFSGGGYTYNIVSLSTTASGTTFAITGANTFATLTIINTTVSFNAVGTIGANQVVTGTLTITGFDNVQKRFFLRSDIPGVARSINAGTTSLTNVDFRDITAGGAAAWTGTSLGNAGGNTGITTTTPVTRYKVGGTGSWSSTTMWSATSGGASGASVPLCHDTVIINANSFSAGSQTLTADRRLLGADINWTGATNSPTWTISTTGGTEICGSLTLISAMTVLNNASFTFGGRGSHTITMNGKAFGSGGSGTVIMEAVGGTYTLQDDFVSTRAMTVTDGSLVFNGHDLTALSLTAASTRDTFIDGGTGNLTLTGTGTVLNMSAVNTTSDMDQCDVHLTDSGATARVISIKTTNPLQNVYIEAGTSNLTLTNVVCNDLDFTGWTGLLLNGSTPIVIGGDLTFDTGMTVQASTRALSMSATSGTHIIDTKGITIDKPFSITGVGGTFVLASDLIGGASRTLLHTSGTFDSAGFDIRYGVFSSSNTNVRTIDFVGSNVSLSDTGVVWICGVNTNQTVVSGAWEMEVMNASATTKQINAGGATLHDLIFSGVGTGSLTIVGNNSWNGIYARDANHDFLFTAAGTNTIRGDDHSFIPPTAGLSHTIDSTTATDFTLSKSSGFINTDHLTITSSDAGGGATWYAGPNSVDGGSGNSGWIFAAAELSVTKSLGYKVKLTPAAKTKGLIYKVKYVPGANTKGLIYRVKSTPTAKTKSLKYTVKTTPAAKTKGLVYQVKTTPSAITKSLQYVVVPAVAEIAITKDLEYRVKAPVATSKSLAYAVKRSLSATKAIEYRVKSPVAKNKTLTYRVLAEGLEQKDLEYQVVTDVTKNKSLQYSVLTEGLETKGITYQIERPVTVQKSLAYSVITDSLISKGLQYAVEDQNAVTKGLAYAVKRPVSVAKGLTYRIKLSRSLNKGLQYTIEITHQVAKGLSYKVVTEGLQQKTMSYVVAVPVTLSKSLQYRVLAPHTIGKSLQYAIFQGERLITKSMRYVVSGYPYHKGTSPYSTGDSPYTPATSPFTKAPSPYGNLAKPYHPFPR